MDISSTYKHVQSEAEVEAEAEGEGEGEAEGERGGQRPPLHYYRIDVVLLKICF